MLDEFEDVEYDRKAVEVVLTIIKLLIGTTTSYILESDINLLMLCHLQDTSENLQVETYVWKNKDDPDLYGEWDFEV